jgi:hypothetical protein
MLSLVNPMLPTVFAILVAAAGPAAAPVQAPKVGVTLTFVEPSGKTLAEKKIEPIIGSETPTEVKDKNRTLTVKTTVRTTAQANCYMAEIAVRDQDIDSTGRFSKKEWQTRGEVCAGLQITLGPRDETRVRVAVGALRPGK